MLRGSFAQRIALHAVEFGNVPFCSCLADALASNLGTSCDECWHLQCSLIRQTSPCTEYVWAAWLVHVKTALTVLRYAHIAEPCFLVVQGMAFAKNVFGQDEDARPVYENVASAVFTAPQIATCGLTEEEAVEQHGDLKIFTSSFKCDAGPQATSLNTALCFCICWL